MAKDRLKHSPLWDIFRNVTIDDFRLVFTSTIKMCVRYDTISRKIGTEREKCVCVVVGEGGWALFLDSQCFFLLFALCLFFAWCMNVN